MKAQQHTEFAVIVNKSGGIPSVMNQASSDYWIMMNNLNYEKLHEGTKKECNAYCEEMISQLNEIDYFNA